MALSDEEQRLLAQLEAALAADDPKLAHALRGTATRRLPPRHAAVAGLAFLAGLALLVAGMEWTPVVSVLGFVVMLAAAVFAFSGLRDVGRDQRTTPASPRDSSDGDFIERLEERLRRRPDETP